MKQPWMISPWENIAYASSSRRGHYRSIVASEFVHAFQNLGCKLKARSRRGPSCSRKSLRVASRVAPRRPLGRAAAAAAAPFLYKKPPHTRRSQWNEKVGKRRRYREKEGKRRKEKERERQKGKRRERQRRERRKEVERGRTKEWRKRDGESKQLVEWGRTERGGNRVGRRIQKAKRAMRKRKRERGGEKRKRELRGRGREAEGMHRECGREERKRDKGDGRRKLKGGKVWKENQLDGAAKMN